MGYEVITGSALDVLRTLEAGSAQTCVTSPPYFGLRDYGIDGQIGLEETPDEYVAKLVEVFREVRRVLKDDGTLWLNLGDSYANDTKWGGSSGGKHAAGLHGQSGIGRGKRHTGLKSKDLIGVPWMLAFALRADGWYLRSDIIWHKPNPMPESVTDRPTKAHEYLFLLSKSPSYYYDAEAIKEPLAQSTLRNVGHIERGKSPSSCASLGQPQRLGGHSAINGEARNRRSVWTVPTKPFSEAHFAVFPPELIEPCILAGSREGDTVLDPFNGAATTGVVAVKYRRNYLGVELNPDYVEMSLRRLADADAMEKRSRGVWAERPKPKQSKHETVPPLFAPPFSG